MKQLHSSFRRFSVTGALSSVVAVAAVSSSASAVTYQQQVFGITNTNTAGTLTKTSAGYTMIASLSAGDATVTANGLLLSYATIGSGERPVITNVSDITGAGIQLDRYLSVTLGPDNIDALDGGYTGGYTVDLTNVTRSFSLETGGHLEIRSSLDGFANPLASWAPVNAVTGNLNPVAAGLTSNSSLINANGSVNSVDAPIEFRIYTWYDTAGIMGYLGDNTDSIRFAYTVTATPIPEPSGLMLLGAAGIVPLLRRRRN